LGQPPLACPVVHRAQQRRHIQRQLAAVDLLLHRDFQVQ